IFFVAENGSIAKTVQDAPQRRGVVDAGFNLLAAFVSAHRRRAFERQNAPPARFTQSQQLPLAPQRCGRRVEHGVDLEGSPLRDAESKLAKLPSDRGPIADPELDLGLDQKFSLSPIWISRG